MKIQQLFKLFATSVFFICLMVAPSIAKAQITNVIHPGGSPYTTLQDAIDNPATVDGDIISVDAGIFFGNIYLNKSLAIYGIQRLGDACTRADIESILMATGGPVLTLESGSRGSIIDGFTFSGGNKSIVSIGGPLDDLIIRNCRFLGFTENAIFLNDPGINISIDGNYIDGSSQLFPGGLIHLDTDNFNGFSLTHNCIFNGVSGTGFFVDGYHNVGPSLYRPPAIIANRFSNNGTGVNLGASSFGHYFLSNSGSIIENLFDNNALDGLQGGMQNVVIQQNEFRNNGRYGLNLTSFGIVDDDMGAQNNLISCNLFTGNLSAGIFMSETQEPGTIATNQIHNNNFEGNFIGLEYEGPEIIDAQDNWWGSSTGPTIASNPGGTGDPIDNDPGYVDYSPFLIAAEECFVCIPITFYRDADNDGYGNPNITTTACVAPTGYVSDNTDCEDNSSAINPGADEICNGIDDDCDNLVDDDDPDVMDRTTWFRDYDGDGYGNPAISIESCHQPVGYVSNNYDCDDNNRKKKEQVLMCKNGKEKCVKPGDIGKHLNQGYVLGPCENPCKGDKVLMCHNGHIHCVKPKDVPKNLAKGWTLGRCVEPLRIAGRGEAVELTIIDQFKLTAAPNPLSSTTTIRYELPVDSKINITLYDPIGRVVATLVDAARPAGSYNYVLDASRLATGLYFYRMTAVAGEEKFVQSQKLLIIK